MKVDSVITPKTTGYAAAAAMGLCMYSAVTKNKALKKAHKPLAWTTAIAAVLHTGLIEYYNYKYRG